MRWLLGIVGLYLLLWFVVVGVEAFMQRSLGDESPFDLLELHHAYIGAALGALGFRLDSVTGVLLMCFGIVLLIDDLVQHSVQTHGEGRTSREYRSPLHVLFARTLWRIPGVPRLVAFLDDRWWLLGILAAVAVLAFGCASLKHALPRALRPDTRRIVSFDVDSALVRQAAAHFMRVFPNEASLCFDGTLVPRVDRPGALHAHLTAVQSAVADSADVYHVYLPRAPRSGCASTQLLAIAHDHTTVGPLEPCTHSDPDAFVLFEDRRALFSLVFCPGGRGEALFQDGRRGAFAWARPVPGP